MRLSLPAALAASAFALASPSALAQSINIDFGPTTSLPPSSYRAAAKAGVWNTFDSLPTNQRFNLVNLCGQPIGARIYNNGGTAILSASIAGAAPADAAMMDDMLLSFNNPVDACIWIENLAGGTYEVTIYAMTPNEPERMCRVRVDFASPGPMMVGGSWPGAHQPGVTYGRFTVTIAAGGTIGLHSGLFGGNIQSGINGIQIVRLGECAPDFNCSGTATVQDIFDYVGAWFAADQRTDVNGVNGITAQDIFDYLGQWFAGC